MQHASKPCSRKQQRAVQVQQRAGSSSTRVVLVLIPVLLVVAVVAVRTYYTVYTCGLWVEFKFELLTFSHLFGLVAILYMAQSLLLDYSSGGLVARGGWLELRFSGLFRVIVSVYL
jgi:hypothetical protein